MSDLQRAAQDLTSNNLNYRSSPQAVHIELAGFWVRVLAAAIDACIMTVIKFPIVFLSAMFVGFLFKASTFAGAMVQLVNFIVNLVVIYYYAGYFYSTKGATPGKLILGLRVLNAHDGTKLTYMQAFCREVLGKMASLLILGIGFLMVAFRDDHKALHDILFNTQVVKEEK